jgi:hypothetical protein
MALTCDLRYYWRSGYDLPTVLIMLFRSLNPRSTGFDYQFNALDNPGENAFASAVTEVLRDAQVITAFKTAQYFFPILHNVVITPLLIWAVRHSRFTPSPIGVKMPNIQGQQLKTWHALEHNWWKIRRRPF